MRVLRIVIVDDEEGARKSLGMRLANAGHEVHECADGEDLLHYLATHAQSGGRLVSPDLIITDYNMGNGRINGLEVLRRVRADMRHEHVRIVVFSGDDSPELSTKVVAEGGSLLSKPGIDGLLDYIAELASEKA